MGEASLDSLQRLQALPKLRELALTLDRLMSVKKGRVKSITLFGSMAKGNFDAYSDCDLFLIVDDEEDEDFMKRMKEYSRLTSYGVEVFVYRVSEAEEMMKDFHTLLLDALKNGILIYDEGVWTRLKERLTELIAKGVLKPVHNGWDIDSSKLTAT